MATHRLAVNDRPARRAKFLDDALAKRKQIGEKPIGTIASAPISRGGPSVTVFAQVEVERRAAHRADSRAFALVAMREHDEAPFQSGGTLIR